MSTLVGDVLTRAGLTPMPVGHSTALLDPVQLGSSRRTSFIPGSIIAPPSPEREIATILARAKVRGEQPNEEEQRAISAWEQQKRFRALLQPQPIDQSSAVVGDTASSLSEPLPIEEYPPGYKRIYPELPPRMPSAQQLYVPIRPQPIQSQVEESAPCDPYLLGIPVTGVSRLYTWPVYSKALKALVTSVKKPAKDAQAPARNQYAAVGKFVADIRAICPPKATASEKIILYRNSLQAALASFTKEKLPTDLEEMLRCAFYSRIIDEYAPQVKAAYELDGEPDHVIPGFLKIIDDLVNLRFGDNRTECHPERDLMVLALCGGNIEKYYELLTPLRTIHQAYHVLKESVSRGMEKANQAVLLPAYHRRWQQWGWAFETMAAVKWPSYPLEIGSYQEPVTIEEAHGNAKIKRLKAELAAEQAREAALREAAKKAIKQKPKQDPRYLKGKNVQKGGAGTRSNSKQHDTAKKVAAAATPKSRTEQPKKLEGRVVEKRAVERTEAPIVALQSTRTPKDYINIVMEGQKPVLKSAEGSWYARAPAGVRYRLYQKFVNGETGAWAKALGEFHEKYHDDAFPQWTGMTPGQMLELLYGMQVEPMIDAYPDQEVIQGVENLVDALQTGERNLVVINDLVGKIPKRFFSGRTFLGLMRAQAVAEGVKIKDWDKDWAKHHYNDDIRSLSQVIMRWFDQQITSHYEKTEAAR